jgi:hypothetical protein
MGFWCPSAHSVARVHVRLASQPAILPPASSRSPKPSSSSTKGSHTLCYGAALRLSQPLSDLVPLTATPPFSGRWHSWACVLQGFVPLIQPPVTHRPGNTLLALLPRLRCPEPRLEHRWAHDAILGCVCDRIFRRLQGLRPYEDRPATCSHG